MKHIGYLNFNSPFEGIPIHEQRFGSNQGVQLFQYTRC